MGLEVKECIEINILECIRNVFIKYKENVVIVSNIVYVLNVLCFLVMVNEWISVVFVSYGINEVFFIGF